MRQDFHEIVRLPSDREAVWRTVSDLPSVLSWISIVGAAEEIEPERRYRALLEDRLGPFKLRADLDIHVEEREHGRLVRAHGDGEDRQIGSRLVVDVTLALADEGATTLVEVSGAYEVTGRPATLGAGAIRKKASRILAEFFASAEAALSGEAAE
jgi:carbon monoxide dehydrogenase subunit G